MPDIGIKFFFAMKSRRRPSGLDRASSDLSWCSAQIRVPLEQKPLLDDRLGDVGEIAHLDDERLVQPCRLRADRSSEPCHGLRRQRCDAGELSFTATKLAPLPGAVVASRRRRAVVIDAMISGCSLFASSSPQNPIAGASCLSRCRDATKAAAYSFNVISRTTGMPFASSRPNRRQSRSTQRSKPRSKPNDITPTASGPIAIGEVRNDGLDNASARMPHSSEMPTPHGRMKIATGTASSEERATLLASSPNGSATAPPR